MSSRERLEYLRGELRAERMSWAELAELQGLADMIEPGDVELLEAAGVPEFADEAEPGPAIAPGDCHRLAVRAAKAARLAGAPIGYYAAYADVRELEATGVATTVSAVAEWFALHYGASWLAAAHHPADSIVGVTSTGTEV